MLSETKCIFHSFADVEWKTSQLNLNVNQIINTVAFNGKKMCREGKKFATIIGSLVRCAK